MTGKVKVSYCWRTTARGLPLCAGQSWALGMKRVHTRACPLKDWPPEEKQRAIQAPLPFALWVTQPKGDPSCRVEGQQDWGCLPTLLAGHSFGHLPPGKTHTAFSTFLSPGSRNCSLTSPILELSYAILHIPSLISLDLCKVSFLKAHLYFPILGMPSVSCDSPPLFPRVTCTIIIY